MIKYMKKIFQNLINFFQQKSSKKYFVIFGIFFLICFIFFQSTFSYHEQKFFIKAKLWSDFAAHLPLIRSFSLGDNWPVEYPFFAGLKINYHFLFYAVVGGLERIGFRIDYALNFLSALGGAGLLTSIVWLGEYYFSFSAGLLAVFLFLFNGSLVFIQFFKENIFTNFENFYQTLVTQRTFVSFGPWNGDLISAFWNLNIFTNQRHLGLGISILLFLIGWFELFFKEKNKIYQRDYLLIAFLIVLLPLFHQASFAVLVIYLLIGFFSNPKFYLKKHLLFFIITGFISFKSYLMFKNGFIPILDIGFLALEKNLPSIFNYCLQNFGLYLFFIPLFLFLVFFKKDYFKFRKIYLTGLFIFIISFIFRFSTDMINNHKFITIFLIIMNLGVAGLLVKTYQTQVFLKQIGVSLIVFFLTFSGLIDLFPILNDGLYVQKDYQRSEFGRWVVTIDPHSVFLVNEYLYNPISLAGRKLYLDYGYFSWSMGYPDHDRRKKQDQIFSKDIAKDDWCNLLSSEGIDYLALDQNQGDFMSKYRVDQSSFIYFSKPLIFDKAENQSCTYVYDVKEICQ